MKGESMTQPTESKPRPDLEQASIEHWGKWIVGRKFPVDMNEFWLDFAAQVEERAVNEAIEDALDTLEAVDGVLKLKEETAGLRRQLEQQKDAVTELFAIVQSFHNGEFEGRVEANAIIKAINTMRDRAEAAEARLAAAEKLVEHYRGSWPESTWKEFEASVLALLKGEKP